MRADEPPPDVLQAFGIAEMPVPLAGGEGRSFRAGGLVLKHSDLDEEVAWAGRVLQRLAGRGFRVAPYRQTMAGEWSADGWFAQTLLPGAHAMDRWREVLAACEAYHRALAGIVKPAFMAARTSPWAVADRIAWGEEALVYAPQLAEFVEPLAARLRPVDLPDQVIHGDFSGNVLFADGEAPAVIDFTPYWRPASFARAIVVVDAITWHRGDEVLFDIIADDPESHQMLVRAELRRLLEVDQQHRQFGRDGFTQLPAHRRTVDLILRRG